MRYLFILLILCSCASNKANRKLKRAERLTNEAIALGAEVRPDTVFKEIPIFIPQVRVDSIFTSRVGDTVYLEKDRLKIKYLKLPGDSVFIEGKCDSLTIIKEVPISVTKTVTTGITILTVVQWVVLALIVGAILCKILWR